MKNSNIHSVKSGQIRIIGGQWRGRKLPVLERATLRPTTDRMRETLFNWLARDIQQARCLDCYAGTGALALEALSRYADQATLLEFDRATVQQLNKNLHLLSATQCDVIQTNTLTWLTKPGIPFNVVFVDPPFWQGLVTPTCQLLEEKGWLAADAVIYVECEIAQDHLATPAHWYLDRQKIAGQVASRLYRRRDPHGDK